MVRPLQIRANEETASSNFFQKNLEGLSPENIKTKALNEFDGFVNALRNAGVNVLVTSPSKLKDTPDAHFPNNWVSFHSNGDVAMYPMFASNRREERNSDYFDLLESHGFIIENIVDYSSAEESAVFLEGTGSMILDRVNRKAYCALSARTDEDLIIEFCEDFEYTPILFSARQSVNRERRPIYHTNVMLSIGESFAVICISTIDDKKERKMVMNQLREDHKEIIDISEKQMEAFAGNLLQVKGADGKNRIIMSQTAYKSLRREQLERLVKHGEIVYSNVPTIEALGGGSVRCMMAEVFLPKKNLD